MPRSRPPRFSPSFQVAAVSLVLVPLVTYFTFIAGVPFLGRYDYPGRIRAQLAGALILGGWLLWKLLVRREWRRTPLDGPVCALLAVLALSTLFSTDTRRSLEGLLSAAVYVLAFYMFLDLRQHALLWTGLLNAVVIVAGVACLLGFLQLVWWYGDLPPVVRANPLLILQGDVGLPRLSVLGNPNMLAIYLLLTFPLAVQRWLAARRRPVRWLLGFALGAALIVFALTGSRGGLLGLGAAAAVAVILLLRRSALAAAMAWRVVALAVVVVAAALVLVLVRGGLALTGSAAGVRWESWQVALQVLAARPLLGSGPGTFGAQFLHYGDLQAVGDVHSHAHSLYVTVAAEMGLLGVLALVWIGVGFLRGLGKQARAAAGFTVAQACVVGLAGRAAHSLVDTFLEEPVIILLTLLLAAGALREFRPSGRRAARGPLLLAAVVFVVMCGASIWIDRGFAAHHSAREAAMDEDWEGAAAWLEVAVDRDPAYHLYAQEAAFAQGVLACGDPSYLASSIAAYRKSLLSWSYWPLDHANLAVLLAGAGDLDGAISEAERAAELDPSESVYACWLGMLLEERGQHGDTAEAYASCLALEPAWLTSAFWDGTTWRAAALAEMIAQAESRVLSDGGLLARASLRNYAGFFEEALADASDYGAEHPDSASAEFEQSRALAALGMDEDALQLLDGLLVRTPLYGPAWMLRGQIRLLHGDFAGAGDDFANGGVLAAGPEALYWQGRLAEARGDAEEAMIKYGAAIAEATKPTTTHLAPSLAGRLPLPVERLPCLQVLRSRESFLAPALRLASLLEQSGRCADAMSVYGLVLAQEPYAGEARERVDELNCEVDGS